MWKCTLHEALTKNAASEHDFGVGMLADLEAVHVRLSRVANLTAAKISKENMVNKCMEVSEVFVSIVFFYIRLGWCFQVAGLRPSFT